MAEVSQDKQLSEKLLPNLHAACESVEAERVGVELVEWPSGTGWHTCRLAALHVESEELGLPS